MDATGRLLARLLPVILPLAGCGGATADSSGTIAAGAGGSSVQGGAGGTTGGSSGAAGPGGTGAGGAVGPGAGGAQGGSGPGAGGAHGGSTIACVDTPLLPDADTGYLVCQGTDVHRPKTASCPNHLPLPSGACANIPSSACHLDTDCTASAHGYCAPNSGGGAPICGCHYGCVADAECGAGQICLCGPDIGACVTSSCRTDADCPGALCLSYLVPSSCTSTTAFACTTPADTCVSDDDCGSGGGPQHQVCSHDGAKRVCVAGPGLCAGRPLIVEASTRLAALVHARGWS